MSRVVRLSGTVGLIITLVGCGGAPAAPPAKPVRIVHAVIADTDLKRHDDALTALLQLVKANEDIDAAALVIASNFSAVPVAPPAAEPPPLDPKKTEGAAGATVPTSTDSPAGQQNTDTTKGAAEAASNEAAITKRFVTLFENESLGVPVYLVPAGRVLEAKEDAAIALSNWRRRVEAIRVAIGAKPGGTQITDLTGCYTAPTAENGRCSADLPGSQVRFVGYPALSGAPLAAAEPKNTWTGQFKTAMDAQSEGRFTVLVAPLTMPVDPASINDSWMATAGKAQVALGVAATATARRETFASATVWRAPGLSGQWWITPQLVSDNTTSTSANGVSVISVAPRQTAWRDMFWYTAPPSGTPSPFASPFTGVVNTLDGAGNEGPAPRRHPWLRYGAEIVTYPFMPLWRLGGSSLPDLPKAAVLLIALLAAFLTSVAVWQIPPAKDDTGATPQASASTADAATLQRSLLENNFARTVVAGLGGFVVAKVMLDSFSAPATESPSQQFYVVWFVFGFFVMLLLSSIAKSLAEGFRVVSLVRNPPRTPQPPSRSQHDNDAKAAKMAALAAKMARPRWPWSWFWLTSIDAFFNLIQGRNELKSTRWQKDLGTAQLDSLVAIDRICEHLRAAIVDYSNRDFDKECEEALAAGARAQAPASAPAPAPAPVAGPAPAGAAPVPGPAPPPVPPQVPAPAGPTPTTSDQPLKPGPATQTGTDAPPTPGPVPVADETSGNQTDTMAVGQTDEAPAQPADTRPPTDTSDGVVPSEPAKPPASDVVPPPAAPVTEPAAADTPVSIPGNGTPADAPPAKPTTDDCPERLKRRRIELSSVRVAVSVLSEDGKRVFYVSWPPDSSSKTFDSKSMAYVCVAAGVTRWWRQGYGESKIVLLKNEGNKELPEVDGKLMLSDFFQNRASDYLSFIVFPIPLRPSEKDTRAGLHISFKDKNGVHSIWCKAGRTLDPIVDPATEVFPYYDAPNLLDSTPDELRRLFQQSLNVIESLLRHFNEKVFVNALQSRQGL